MNGLLPVRFGDFRIELAKNEHLAGIEQLMRTSFATDNLFSVALPSTVSDYVKEDPCIVARKCLKDDPVVSLVTIEEKTGKVVGARLSSITTREEEFSESYQQQANHVRDVYKDDLMYRIYAMFGEMEERAKIFDTYKVDRVLTFKCVSVYKEYSNRGIASKMFETTVKLARAHGLPLIRSVFVGEASPRVAEKNGFELVLKEEARGYLFKGKPLWPDLDMDVKVRYMVRKL